MAHPKVISKSNGDKSPFCFKPFGTELHHTNIYQYRLHYTVHLNTF